jgi:hypothetical protein
MSASDGLSGPQGEDQDQYCSISGLRVLYALSDIWLKLKLIFPPTSTKVLSVTVEFCALENCGIAGCSTMGGMMREIINGRLKGV